jgi:glycolate oxidase FAD binding subunit
VLGVSCVSGRGEGFKAGGRVVKNVTGYDLPKLLAGSYGTLAAITAITLKALPAAETEETVVIHDLDAARADKAMSIAMQSEREVSRAAQLRNRTCLRLEGVAQSVTYRGEKLRQLLKPYGDMAVLAAEASRALWQDIRDVTMLADNQTRAVWRISVPPLDGAEVFNAIAARLDCRGLLDWAGGLIWLDVPAEGDGGAAAIRGAIKQGHATLIRAPQSLRLSVPPFHPQPAALTALSQRVKQAFDPNGVLNPGRMTDGSQR